MIEALAPHGFEESLAYRVHEWRLDRGAQNANAGAAGDAIERGTSSQPMSVTVAAGTTIDVVVLAIDKAPAGANAPDPDGAVPIDGGPGAFVRTCTAQ